MARTGTRPATASGPSIFEELASRYPRTVAAFATMQEGEAALRAVADLERRWVRLSTASHPESPLVCAPNAGSLPPCRPEDTYEVVIAGGGLGLLAGAALAARGLRVLVFDRDRVGAAHREWNISERELAAFVRSGLFTDDKLRSAVAARYRRGMISFDAVGAGVPYCPLALEGVLDVSLDAQALLDLARERFLAAGGTIKEGRRFVRLHTARSGPVASVFEVHGSGGVEYYRARLAIDTMGSVSPIAMSLNAGILDFGSWILDLLGVRRKSKIQNPKSKIPFDGVCPTVGTVLEGLDLDPSTGDVLVSVAPAQGGRQLIWEGFPGRAGQATVYLFYYDRAGAAEAREQGLLDLFERYFTLLPSYRSTGIRDQGSGMRDRTAGRPDPRSLVPHPRIRHLKPVFGYIPARHGRSGVTSARGLLCLGDSAAGQSPLTFCGFGSFVRHIGRVSEMVEYALRHDLLEAGHLKSISPHQPNLRVAWVFSRFMQPWPGSGDTAVNRIMNVFCAALREAGPTTTVRFLQDRYTFGQYLRVMLLTARRYPGVFALTARVLGPAGLLKWLGDIIAFAADDLFRNTCAVIGKRGIRAVESTARRYTPGLALKLMSRRTYWATIR